MNPADYEAYRQELERQLRLDWELLYSAYLAKLRAFETVFHLSGQSPPPHGLPEPPARLSLQPASPSPTAGPASPTPSRRHKAFELYYAIEEILPQLPEVFGTQDVTAALGWKPHRASLFRALQDLCQQRLVAREEKEPWTRTTFYRRLPTPPSTGDPDDEDGSGDPG